VTRGSNRGYACRKQRKECRICGASSNLHLYYTRMCEGCVSESRKTKRAQTRTTPEIGMSLAEAEIYLEKMDRKWWNFK